jgi:hypothetical protein
VLSIAIVCVLSPFVPGARSQRTIDSFRATVGCQQGRAGLFQKEAETVRLLTQPHVAKLIGCMVHADAKAELGEARKRKDQAEINLDRASGELKSVEISNTIGQQRAMCMALVAEARNKTQTE